MKSKVSSQKSLICPERKDANKSLIYFRKKKSAERRNHREAGETGDPVH